MPRRQHLGGHERRGAELSHQGLARRQQGREVEVAQLHRAPIQADQVVVRLDGGGLVDKAVPDLGVPPRHLPV
eukprot:9171238-Pyramimonas_sp.AAC.1